MLIQLKQPVLFSNGNDLLHIQATWFVDDSQWPVPLQRQLMASAPKTRRNESRAWHTSAIVVDGSTPNEKICVNGPTGVEYLVQSLHVSHQ